VSARGVAHGLADSPLLPGEKKREAARRAAGGFVGSVLEGLAGLRDVREAAALLQRALTAAHAEVLRGHSDVWGAGTAALCGTALLPAGDEHYVACVAVVGNVHCFLCSPRHPPLEITAGSLAQARNAQDPGGRLGPYVDAGDPDLRNMQRYCVECRDGDWLWLVTDSLLRNCDVAAVFGAGPLDQAGPTLLRAAEEHTRPLRDFLARNPTAAAPPDMRGTLDHASVLGVLVGRPPVLATQFEWCGESSLAGEPLPLPLGETSEWSRVFVCLPPYAPGTVRLECRNLLMTASSLDHVGSPLVPGMARVRSFGWLPLSDQVTRKQLGRWLHKSIVSASLVVSERNLTASEILQRDVLPERDTIQIIGRGRGGVVDGVTVNESVVEVYGRDNALIATRRLVHASCVDARQLLEFVKNHMVTAGVMTLPSLYDWVLGLLVPANEKY
jgi:hypothetical protein